MIKVKVVSVKGRCNAGLEASDTFLLERWQFTPQGHSKACQVAFAAIIASASRLKLHGGRLCVSCPDPATGEGGNVIFELSAEASHADRRD